MATFNGGGGADTYAGGATADTITGNGGNDTLSGGGGNDSIFGGNGLDSLAGGSGDDSMDGGSSNDTVDGGIGNDSITGGSGDDLLYGGNYGDIGATFITNGTFSSGTSGWTGTDLEVNPESSYFAGGSGTNTVFEVDGAAGQTTVLQQSFEVEGTQSASLTFRSALRTSGAATVGVDGFTVDVRDGSGAVIFTQTILPGTSFTNYTLNFTFPAAGAYTLRFTEVGNNDSLGAIIDDIQITSTSAVTGTGNDTISGGLGNDTISGFSGNDSLSGDEGTDSLTGGAGNDSLYGGTENDTLAGDAGADLIDGGAGADLMTGGDGDDVFNLSDGYGADTITGGEAAETVGDTINTSALTTGVNVTLTGNEAGTVTAGANVASFSEIERWVLTAQNDTFNGGAASSAEYVDGGAGNDSLLGGSGNDSLFGGTGADSLNGGAGNDSLVGGDGNDTFTLSDGFGSDTIRDRKSVV